MRSYTLFFVLLASLLACRDEGTTQPQAPLAEVFEIHLQDGFSETPVVISVDQAQVFASTVSTGFIVAFAAIIPVQLTQGTHKLTVTIAHTVSKDTSFAISDTLFVGVSYNSTTRTIDYRFQRNRFYYR